MEENPATPTPEINQTSTESTTADVKPKRKFKITKKRIIIVFFAIVLVILTITTAFSFVKIVNKNPQDYASIFPTTQPGNTPTPFPTLTILPSDDWVKYEDDLYGISFSYPPDWKPYNTKQIHVEGLLRTIGAVHPVPNVGGFGISIRDEHINDVVDNQINIQIGGQTFLIEKTDIEKDGVFGIKVDSLTHAGNPSTTYFFDKDNLTYAVSGGSPVGDVWITAANIYRTFKFTDTNKIDKRTGWNIVINKKYRYSYNYPSTFYFNPGNVGSYDNYYVQNCPSQQPEICPYPNNSFDVVIFNPKDDETLEAWLENTGDKHVYNRCHLTDPRTTVKNIKFQGIDAVEYSFIVDSKTINDYCKGQYIEGGGGGSHKNIVFLKDGNIYAISYQGSTTDENYSRLEQILLTFKFLDSK